MSIMGPGRKGISENLGIEVSEVFAITWGWRRTNLDCLDRA